MGLNVWSLVHVPQLWLAVEMTDNPINVEEVWPCSNLLHHHHHNDTGVCFGVINMAKLESMKPNV